MNTKRKKSLALVQFRQLMRETTQNVFRTYSPEHKKKIWDEWLDRNEGITPQQRESWKVVSPWAKRERG